MREFCSNVSLFEKNAPLLPASEAGPLICDETQARFTSWYGLAVRAGGFTKRTERMDSTMEIQEMHRGRLIDHIQLVVTDISASRKFYEAVLGVLRVPIEGTEHDFFWADELVVSSVDSVAAQGRATGRCHLAFQADDQATVDAFHAAGLENGGQDNGPPGERPYHPGYYAAFLLDPDGNNIEAVYHGEANRSAASVKITF